MTTHCKRITGVLMLDGVPARPGRDTRYGLGVIIHPTPNGLTYGHSGFFPGWQTDVMYFAELRTAIAVQVNTSARPMAGLLVALSGVLKGS